MALLADSEQLPHTYVLLLQVKRLGEYIHGGGFLIFCFSSHVHFLLYIRFTDQIVRVSMIVQRGHCNFLRLEHFIVF